MSEPPIPLSPDPSIAGPLDRAAARELLRDADALAARGEFESAVPLYRRLIGHEDPDIHTAALLGLADALYRLDDEPGAMAAWTAATQAPENAFGWLAWKQLAGAQVRAGDLRGAIDSYREAERRAPSAERPAIASRLGWLYKETGDTGRARGYFGKARGGLDTPFVVFAILAVTVGIGLAQISTGFPADPFTQLLGLDKAAVARGELYRLVSVVLVHAGVIHLAFNMYALFLVGPLVERMYGHWRTLLLYVVTAAAASTLSYVFVPNDAVGASGAIFGLFGVLVSSIWRWRPMVGQIRALASQLVVIIVINLVLNIGLNAGGVGIDTFAHVGGLLAGLWLGFVLPPTGVPIMATAFRRPGEPAQAQGFGPYALLQLVGVLVLIAIISAGVLFGTSERQQSPPPAARAAGLVRQSAG